MSTHSEVCPVCNGRGEVADEGNTKTCHGCQGRGWIVIHEEIVYSYSG